LAAAASATDPLWRTRQKISSGLLVFALAALYGWRMIYRGLKGVNRDWLGEQTAPRWSYVVFGLICQAPLICFVLFLYRQGYFAT
jgi:hypothetical protein